MKIVLENTGKCETFVTLFSHMKHFTEHINFIFQEDGLFVQGMDMTHVIIFEVTLPKTWFHVYELAQNVTIGINTNIMAKVLSVYDKTQQIEMSTETDSDVFCIQYLHSSNKLVFDKTLEIPLLDLEYELMEIPEIDYQAEITLNSNVFATLVSQLKQFGENLTITCSEENILLSAHSLEKGKMMTNIPIDDLHEYSIEEDQTLELSFALKYISEVAMYQKVAKHIGIFISQNYPMKLLYTLDEEHARLVFYMAPKMED
jgi:proliferating cell nuclear antigen